MKCSAERAEHKRAYLLISTPLSMVEITQPLVRFSLELQRMRLRNANEPSEEFNQAVEEIFHVADHMVEYIRAHGSIQKDAGGDVDACLLASGFRRWLEAAMERFEDQLDSVALLDGFSSWYLGNRHMLSADKQETLNDLLQQRPGGSPAADPRRAAATTVGSPLGMETPPNPARARARSSVDALRKQMKEKKVPKCNQKLPSPAELP